jgi:hypothetical protein
MTKQCFDKDSGKPHIVPGSFMMRERGGGRRRRRRRQQTESHCPADRFGIQPIVKIDRAAPLLILLIVRYKMENTGGLAIQHSAGAHPNA